MITLLHGVVGGPPDVKMSSGEWETDQKLHGEGGMWRFEAVHSGPSRDGRVMHHRTSNWAAS